MPGRKHAYYVHTHTYAYIYIYIDRQGRKAEKGERARATQGIHACLYNMCVHGCVYMHKYVRMGDLTYFLFPSPPTPVCRPYIHIPYVCLCACICIWVDGGGKGWALPTPPPPRCIIPCPYAYLYAYITYSCVHMVDLRKGCRCNKCVYIRASSGRREVERLAGWLRSVKRLK